MSGEKQHTIFTVCPSCHSAYKVPDIVVGKEVTCKKCNAIFEVIKFKPPEKCPPFARIAIEKQLVKQKALVEAMATLNAEKEAGKNITLEQILLEKKLITQDVLDTLIVATTRQLDKEFGVLAIKKNLITKNDVNQALEIQAKHFKNTKACVPISDILIKKGLLSKEACDGILKQQERITGKPCMSNSEPDEPRAEPPIQPPETEEKSPLPGIKEEEKSVIDASAITEAESRVQIYKDKKFFKIRQMDKEFVQSAIDHHFILKQEADDALAKQLFLFEKSKIRRIVGDILVASNMLSRDRCDDLLINQNRMDKRDHLFCDLAVKKGFLPNNIADKMLSELRDRFDDNNKRVSAKDLFIHKEILTKEQCVEIDKELAIQQDKETDDETLKVNARVTVNSVEFQLLVTKDGLQAYLVRDKDLPETYKISDIKDFLMEKKIAYGFVDDSLIQGFIQYEGHKNKRFKIAEGKPVKMGRDGAIKYYFDVDHLKVGALQQGGKIDFKDRGEIPHVSKGDLIAEKIPMIKGEQGIDVYAHPIPIPDLQDPTLRGGTGVEFSQDGIKMYAKVDGQPDASLGGKISVLQELRIPGDVGFETGHVEFEGNVSVAGAVQDGFRVRAAKLTAMEITGADIRTTGDIEVKGGITGATINTQGRVKCKYFKNATISAFGDVVVQKEIIDSKIETSGAIIVQTGKIMSSEITAKDGIESKQIGTDISVPCQLKIGVDTHGENEVKHLNEKILEHEKQKEDLLKKEEALNEAETRSHMEIANLAQVQDKAMTNQKSLEKRLDEVRKAGDKKAVAETEALIKALAEKARNADDEISSLFEKQDKLSEEIADVLSRIKDIDERIQELKEEKRAILAISKKESGDVCVKVSDTIYEGSVIMGRHAKLVLKQSLKRGKIKEVRIGSTGDDSDWEMRVIK